MRHNSMCEVTRNLVYVAAVIWAVTQRFLSSKGEALRDYPNNDCEGD